MLCARCAFRICNNRFKNIGNCVFSVNSHRGVDSYNKNKLPKKIMQRKWKDGPHVPFGTEESDAVLRQFRLLSYNILAQDLLVENMFLYFDIHRQYLRWNYRLQQITEELCNLQPDILCLQEVQHNHLKELLRQYNCRSGQRQLEYVFKKRTGNRCDGCAIIYDKAKFKMIKDKNVEYHVNGDSVLNRENIGIMAKLELRDQPSAVFVAVTTHLLYNPRRHEIRIGQINKLINEIIQFSKDEYNGSTHYPVILTGDFNCSANSGEFGALTATRRPVNQETDNQSHFYEYFMKNIHFGQDVASTLQGQWVTVDYILTSCCKNNAKRIQVNRVYNLPSIKACIMYGKMPNQFNGSDHFSLAIQFSIV